jgi:hypothetical protein
MKIGGTRQSARRFMAAIHTVNKMARDLGEFSAEIERLRRSGRARPAVGQPVAFASCRDPRDRFEFNYPSEWKRLEGEATAFISPRGTLFVRADVTPQGADPWDALSQAILSPGGVFKVRSRTEGLPKQAHGEIVSGSARFRWDGTALPSVGGTAILSLGSALAPPRSATVARYERKLLEAVRRSFKVLPAGVDPGPADRP